MASTATTSEHDAGTASRSLVSLLGTSRAGIVEVLRRRGGTEVSDLADELGISGVAVRRHLGVLADEGLVEAVPSDAADGRRGRPATAYRLTANASRLFPQRYDRFAAEVLDFLADTHGREGLRAFLRWRLEREVDGLRDAVTAEDLHGRLEQLADALSEAGFEASVTPEGDGFTLVQDHCAIYDVAKEHPEVCAYEAATFSHVLGSDVSLSRRETLASGSASCVCTVTPRKAGVGATTGGRDAAGPRGEPRPDSHHDHQVEAERTPSANVDVPRGRRGDDQ